jgi:hypothetical protein
MGEAYMAANIPTLEKADLVKPVQKLLKSDTVDVVKWALQPLTGNWGNESSVGIFRVTGQASDNNSLVDWVMVLKIVQSPANKGMPWEGDDPNSFLYWRREACLFETDFLASVPQIFVVPACYGVVEHPGKIAWLWFEFIDNPCGNDWSLERYCTMAHQLGRFNGAYLARRPLPNDIWLSRNFLRQWTDVNYTKIFMPYWANADQQMLFWEHPVIQKAMGAPNENVLCRFIQEHIRFVDILDRLPQTLCHRDCWVTNLMCRADSEQITLIDWQLVGIGPVGEDLIQLVWGMLEVQSALPVEDVERQLFAQYLQGLRDSGWQGAENQVRFAYAASFVLRCGYLVIWFLNRLFPLRIDAPTDPNHYLATLNDELVAYHTPLIDMVLKRAKEAWDLIEQLEAK